MFLNSLASGFEEQQGFHLPTCDAIDGDALGSAAVAREDSNSRFGPFQKTGEEFTESFVGAIFHGGRAEPDFQCAFDDTGNFVAAGARLHAHGENHRAILFMEGKRCRHQAVWRAPKSAVPTRTSVAPSTMAASKSCDMPMESTGKSWRNCVCKASRNSRNLRK